MDRCVGIWIDHRRATIVSIRGHEVTAMVLASTAEPRVRLSGGSPALGSGIPDGVPESRRDARIGHQLDRFYDAVIEEIHDAARIRICGPGLARLELQKKIDGIKALAPRLEAVEPCDRITQSRFIAKVKESYGVPVRRMAARA
ncbi:MAG TPA: hypothetical protein PLQ13_03515 [Candidatus Krumholzibacteria bacterium]|nr:hypothetical protein [Candidatus Krumholzibacteria bacterium]